MGSCNTFFRPSEALGLETKGLIPYLIVVARGKSVSLFGCICKGEYDSLLIWPFCHRVTFTLVDQCQDPAARRSVSYTIKPNTCKVRLRRPLVCERYTRRMDKFWYVAYLSYIFHGGFSVCLDVCGLDFRHNWKIIKFVSSISFSFYVHSHIKHCLRYFPSFRKIVHFSVGQLVRGTLVLEHRNLLS